MPICHVFFKEIEKQMVFLGKDYKFTVHFVYLKYIFETLLIAFFTLTMPCSLLVSISSFRLYQFTFKKTHFNSFLTLSNFLFFCYQQRLIHILIPDIFFIGISSLSESEASISRP